MKARPELTIESTIVKSNPNDFYVDPYGKVNEIEDDEERILFGTVANPSTQLLEDPEERLWKQAEQEAIRACDPELNPHLKAMNILIDALEKTRK